MNDPEDAEKWDHAQKSGIIVLAKEGVGGGQPVLLLDPTAIAFINGL